MKSKLKVIDVHGRKLGDETPLLCTPLVGRTRERVLAEAASAIAQKPDMLAWRVDFFAQIADTQAVLETLQGVRGLADAMPIIFTCRSVREGGEPIPIDGGQVADLHAAVSAARLVDFVDFEMDNEAAHVRRVREATRANAVRLILSHHNFSYTPGVEFLVRRFLEAERLGADIALVGVMPRDRVDVLTLLAATAQADEKTRIPVVSMSMGPLGSVTRMIGGLFGSGISFGVVESASAPGQIPIGDLVTVHDIIRRARGGEVF